jgi:hypothetical protein
MNATNYRTITWGCLAGLTAVASCLFLAQLAGQTPALDTCPHRGGGRPQIPLLLLLRRENQTFGYGRDGVRHPVKTVWLPIWFGLPELENPRSYDSISFGLPTNLGCNSLPLQTFRHYNLDDE